MSPTSHKMLTRFNPAVPRRTLFAISGGLWTIAGLMLCLRGEEWLEVFPLGMELGLEALSALLAVAGYLLFFIHIVKKNIDRISFLPDRACLFAFTAWRGYLLIVLMIGLGIWLRNSVIPKYYLSIPYSVMGMILLLGSFRFFRQFFFAGTGNG